jgi:hypothetical protein
MFACPLFVEDIPVRYICLDYWFEVISLYVQVLLKDLQMRGNDSQRKAIGELMNKCRGHDISGLSLSVLAEDRPSARDHNSQTHSIPFIAPSLSQSSMRPFPYFPSELRSQPCSSVS